MHKRHQLLMYSVFGSFDEAGVMKQSNLKTYEKPILVKQGTLAPVTALGSPPTWTVPSPP
jgi:hypothetical protein